MPRSGGGVYSKPASTTAVAGTTIESAKFNSVIDDLAADNNVARPVSAGGTGAANAADARTNLGITAANTPFTPTGAIAATNVQAALAEVDGEKAALAGAVFTGQVTISRAVADGSFYSARVTGGDRWVFGRDGTAEGGSNAGSNLAFLRYSDAGSLLGTPIAINRATGAVTFEVAPSVGANAVWHAGTFNPADYLLLTGGTVTGSVAFNLNPSIAGSENWHGGNWGRPLTSAGIGQWQTLTTATGAAAVLPAGGTWACAVLLFNASTGAHTGGAVATVAAGGSTVASAFTGLIWNGFCWRIT